MNIKNIFRRLHVFYLQAASIWKTTVHPKSSVLIVAPHPDDEVIGCGGLIARLVKEGNAPHIVVMTGGEGAHKGCCSISKADIIKNRRQLTRNAMSILGVPDTHIHELNFPDGGISADHGQVEDLKRLIEDLKPQSIFVPHWGEGWSDHVKTAEIVKKLAPASAEIWEYCVWMWYYNIWRGLDWKNAAVLRMTSGEHSQKLKAMDAYIRPLAPCGNPWSGVLPKIFVEANKSNIELYFKCGALK